MKVFICLFVFKQKTAYEMRISDWSSDVCSSDLVQVRVPCRISPLASPHNKRGPRAGADARRSGLMRHVAIVGSGPAGYYTAETLQKADDIAEIGQATGMARVCQYV